MASPGFKTVAIRPRAHSELVSYAARKQLELKRQVTLAEAIELLLARVESPTETELNWFGRPIPEKESVTSPVNEASHA
jgi:hypothetical protein